MRPTPPFRLRLRKNGLITVLWIGLCALPLLAAIWAVDGAEADAQGGCGGPRILAAARLEEMLARPACLGEYEPSQSGPLRRKDAEGREVSESTFSVEPIQVCSDGLKIQGWLYLPLGGGRFPLVVLTNGGGDGSRRIRSFSDFMAPLLAHCGVAAFVHDKRGTGASEGVFRETTYDDYVRDAANCAQQLSKHPRVDPARIGVMGASEGGRIAVLCANRTPIVQFAVSLNGPVVNNVDDRLFGRVIWLQSQGLSMPAYREVLQMWKRAVSAWAVDDPRLYDQVGAEIEEMRKRYRRELLPFSRAELERMPEFAAELPTYRSISRDYLTELGRFRKKWLAIFSELDQVVPTKESIGNIMHYMALSGNREYNVAVLPNCGHTPVDVKTKRLVNFHHLILNWLAEAGLGCRGR